MNNKNKIIAGVIGDPISHSLSPRLHGYWLNKYNINGEYNAYHVLDEKLPYFLQSLKEHNIHGVNVTVPHKEAVLKLVDEVDDVARKVGAVNTIYFDDNKMIGSNTDGYGFLTHLKNSSKSWKAGNGPVVILGAGGAARAVLVSLLDDGVPEIILTNRTEERAKKLASEIDDSRINVSPWENRENILEKASLLVNVTTLGMVGKHPLDLSLDKLPLEASVYDIVYTPLTTNLLREAANRGNETIDGLGMLLHQARPGFLKWFGVEPEVDKGLKHHMLKALS